MSRLRRLQRLATALRPLMPWLLLVAIVSLLLFIFVLLTMDAQASNRYILPLLIAMIWALSAYSFIQIFSGIDLAVPDEQYSWWKKLKLKLRRLFHTLIILVFVATTLTGLVLSWRLINIWLQDYG